MCAEVPSGQAELVDGYTIAHEHACVNIKSRPFRRQVVKYMDDYVWDTYNIIQAQTDVNRKNKKAGRPTLKSAWSRQGKWMNKNVIYNII